MTIQILPASDENFQFFVPPLFKAMGMAGFVEALWPDNQSEEGQKNAIDRWLAEM